MDKARQPHDDIKVKESDLLTYEQIKALSQAEVSAMLADKKQKAILDESLSKMRYTQ